MSKNFSPNAVNQQTFGAAGFKQITGGTGQVTGDFVAITALEDAEVTTIETAIGDDLGGAVKIPAGVTIYGQFTKITLDNTTNSGRVIAYYRALG